MVLFGPPPPPRSTSKLHIQTMAHLPLYIPDWLETEVGTGEPLSVIRERLEVKNWLTKGLLDEIAASFPRSSDIGVGTGSRDKTCFEEN